MNESSEVHVDRVTIREPRSAAHGNSHVRRALAAALETHVAGTPPPTRASRAALEAAAARAADEIVDAVRRTAR